LTSMKTGNAVKPQAVSPVLRDRGEELVRTLCLLLECVVSVWENSAHFNTPSPEEAGRLPDPFPGEYRILQVLGEGAFGRGLLAEDLSLGWRVALKTLKLPVISTVGPQVLAALRTEALHLAQLDHPNIVRVHAWREVQGEYFLVLQFVAGGSMENRL